MRAGFEYLDLEKLMKLCSILLGLAGVSLMTSHALATSPLRILAGGPASIKLLEPRKADMEKAAGRAIEFVVQPVDVSMAAVSKGLADGAILAFDAKQSLSIAEAKGLAKQNPDNYQSLELFNIKVKAGVHPENPVKSLTRAQLTGILSGEIKTWAPITGQALPITVMFAKNYLFIEKTILTFYLQKDSSTVARTVPDGLGLARAMQKDKGEIAFFPEKFALPDFAPKYLDTEVSYKAQLIMKKNPGPEAQKLFDFLKVQGLLGKN
jgi:hypothetical protein